MRTTVTLEPDVAERLRQIMKERNLTFKEAVNSTLRRGLGEEARTRPYRAPSHAIGLRPGIDGGLVPDAHLAALAIEHGATLHSADSDFTRFPALKWYSPLA